MKTVVLRINPDNPELEKIEQATKLLKAGEILAFPTDTVYGICADPFNEESVKRIFCAKRRSQDKPLQVLISHKTDLQSMMEGPSDLLKRLASEFWPGPLTIVVSAREGFPKWVTVGLNTVGIRMPANRIALELIEAFGSFIAATSANISGHKDPVSADDVLKYMDGLLPLIIDGGPTPGNIPSTVLNISVNPPVILRQGKLGVEDLKRALPDFFP